METKKRERPLKECRVLVTAVSFGRCQPSPVEELEETVEEVIYNPLGRPLQVHELCSMITDIDGLIAGLDEIDSSVLDAANRLKVIARYGVGIDRLDIPAATARGILVTNAPGTNSISVAELTICLMLALGRQLCAAHESTRLGEWSRIDGIGLNGKTIGLVGFGSIGRAVARRLKAFGCRLLATDPFVAAETVADCGVLLVPLEELLPQSDFVSLHLSLVASNAGMVNEYFLGSMKPGAFLVNTARGQLIDEAALVESLEKGHLRGAALDCFAKEPPGRENPLLSLRNVIVTPHTGAHTDDAIAQMSRISMENCLAALQGERPANLINPEAYRCMV